MLWTTRRLHAPHPKNCMSNTTTLAIRKNPTHLPSHSPPIHTCCQSCIHSYFSHTAFWILSLSPLASCNICCMFNFGCGFARQAIINTYSVCYAVLSSSSCVLFTLVGTLISWNKIPQRHWEGLCMCCLGRWGLGPEMRLSVVGWCVHVICCDCIYVS